MKHLAKTLVLAVVVAILSPSAVRSETIIDFDDLSLSNYGAIPDGYQSRAVGTANIEVGYRTYHATDNSTIDDHLLFWNTGYGDLSFVAIASENGRGAEILLTPDAGYAVTLSSFDLAGFNQVDRVARFVRIVDGNDNLLLDLGADLTILGAGPSHSTFQPNFTHAGPIKLQWGVNWNIGIDNIRFSQTRLTVIPEPSSMTIVLLGGALLVSARPVLRRVRRS
ncbi:hypothetical protein [Tautonia marina]|uniref:hypothetical protein n=1 Tax=Tautonia marina TaxID=2653855 RepID=UPI001260C4B5|nr:hypothetical protein [Tautonia marina]